LFGSCIIRILVLTLDSGHHKAMLQGCEHMQKLKTVIWRFPPFTLKIR